MVYLTWGPGVFLQVLSFTTTLYTLWQMCALHEIKGKRFNRYHELGQYAFGQKLGLWLIIPCQLIVMIGLDIGEPASPFLSAFGLPPCNPTKQ